MRDKGEGLFDQSNKFMFAYGKHMSLIPDGTGKLQGEFPLGEKLKEFRIQDWQWEQYTAFDDMNRDYPFRQWYLMSDEERNSMFESYGTPEFEEKFHSHKADESDFTPYLKENADAIRGMDIIKNLANTSMVESEAIVPAGRAFISAFDAFSHAYGSSTLGTGHYDIRGGMKGDRPAADGVLGEGGWWDREERVGKASLWEWKSLTNQYTPLMLQDLERIRKLAAQSVGIEYQGYLDTAHDLSPAQSSYELDAQLKAIDGYIDRNATQRQYLKQKAGARFMLGKIGKMGYARDFSDGIYMEGDELEDVVAKMNADWDHFHKAHPDVVNGMGWDKINMRFESMAQQGIYSTKFDLAPHKYEDAGTRKWDQEHPDMWVPYNTSVTRLPAWLNEGETTIPKWMDMSNDSSYREWEENGRPFLELFEKEFNEKFGSADDRIAAIADQMAEANAKQKEAIDAARKAGEDAAKLALKKKGDTAQAYSDAFKAAIDRIRAEQARRDALPYLSHKYGITKFINKAGFKGTSDLKTWADWYAYRQGVKNRKWHEEHGRKKREMADHFRDSEEFQHEDDLEGEARKHTVDSLDYDENHLDLYAKDDVQYDSDGNIVDYKRILKSFGEPWNAPWALTHEPSLAMFYEKYLYGLYWWQPNTDLTDAIMPPGYIEKMSDTQKESFKPMLEAIQEDNRLRDKAQGLYDRIYAPTVEKYIEKFHPDPANLAHDAAGVTELFDDWSLPYEKRHNQVKFNNRIHHQMDFNVQEDF